MKWVGMYFLKTVSRILRKNKKVLRFKFLEIKFPKTLVLKKNDFIEVGQQFTKEKNIL